MHVWDIMFIFKNGNWVFNGEDEAIKVICWQSWQNGGLQTSASHTTIEDVLSFMNYSGDTFARNHIYGDNCGSQFPVMGTYEEGLKLFSQMREEQFG